MTIGGGEVVDVQPRYHKRFQEPIIEALERLLHGSPEELVLAALDRRYTSRTAAKTSSTGVKLAYGLIGYELVDIVKHCNLSKEVTQQTLETLLLEGRVRKVGGSERVVERSRQGDGASSGAGGVTFWFAQHVWDTLVEEAVCLVSEHHRHYPLRSGLSKEEWRARVNLSPKMAAEVFAVLQAEGRLETVVTAGNLPLGQAGLSNTGGLIRLPGFAPSFTAAQQRQVTLLLQRFQESPYTPPGRAEAESMAGAEVVATLVEQGILVKLGDSVLFLRETYDEALTKLVAYLREHGKMTAAEARDVLGATRKYILPLLEHMDSLRITRRMGDERMLGMTALRSSAQSADET
jgi:selenocysteine-specific elongation factor